MVRRAGEGEGKAILVIGGTRESRELTRRLGDQGYTVVVWTGSEYGRKLALEDGANITLIEPISEEALQRVIQEHGVNMVVDFSLPYPNEVSTLLEDYCSRWNLPCVRFFRSETELPRHPLIHEVYGWAEAAQVAAKLGNTIFLTTGTYNLEVFLSSQELKGKRVVVRVLPEHRVIKKCQDLGLTPRDIVAMQGPFSRELNKAIFRAYKAKVVVTRDSGPQGGTDTKIEAALDLRIPVVVIKRPPIKHQHPVTSLEEIFKLLGE
ncbi:precorrin-6A/cobalt-precorrin-6A reductase [Thermanaeromonas toyohensis ToBE]|uniref:Precorrin-6A/cobalt-precorrin-6A reductase n=1 Tax=Thermanaeromonas toyohensis ToBE TaxID=698762 RepID=A0A1W1VYE6_9FIRM|nr:precorrin-6A reductase [Thermanaeromonas toyohensis]SMB98273.1 precorrin-6A/cobalt-precorrin-6A reductase [Thermanaeromonas toyohensis ToBE]